MSRPQRLARYNAEESARFILQMEDNSDVETTEDLNYSASEDDRESDHVETDNESFDDTVDGCKRYCRYYCKYYCKYNIFHRCELKDKELRYQ